jgi:hypothetical protein
LLGLLLQSLRLTRGVSAEKRRKPPYAQLH